MKLPKNRFFFIFNIVVLLMSFYTISCNNTHKQSNPITSDLFAYLKQRPNAQQLDSLYKEVIMLPADSSYVDVLLMIFKQTIYKKPLRTDILDTALFISKKLNYNTGLAKSYDRKGLNERYSLKYKESVNYHKTALQYWNKTTDTLGKIKCLNSLGVSLRRLNNEKIAMSYYLEALKLSNAIGSKKSIAISLNGIGNVFVNIKQYENALPYFKEALAIEKMRQNKKGINYDLSNIGEVFMFQQQYDSALVYYYEALDIAKQLNYKDNESINYNCIALLFQKKGDFQKSNDYYQLAIPKLEQYNGKRYLSNTFINLGLNYTLLGNYKDAYPNILRGIEIAEELNSPENIILGYQTLSKYYELTSSFKLALVYYKKTITIRDDINNKNTRRDIAALESIYEKELMDNEIKNFEIQLSLQKNQSLMQLIVIVFLLILVLVLITFYRLKRKNNKLIIDQMRNDIEEYLHRIENYENKSTEENDDGSFYQNVAQFGLSEREVEVLLLISQGLKNNEIADSLFVSLSTVKTHTRNIFTKLDVRNRIEATRKAQSI